MIIANVGITLIPQIAAKKDDGIVYILLPAIRLLAVLGWYLELPVLESRVLTVWRYHFSGHTVLIRVCGTNWTFQISLETAASPFI